MKLADRGRKRVNLKLNDRPRNRRIWVKANFVMWGRQSRCSYWHKRGCSPEQAKTFSNMHWNYSSAHFKKVVWTWQLKTKMLC